MHHSLFRRFTLATLVAAFGILLLSAAALASSAQVGSYQGVKSYTFKTLNDNADPTFNQLLGINNSGVISGYFGSGAMGHPNKGYTLVSPYGQNNYTNENFPGSVQTQVTGINNHGDTSGFWVDANGTNFGFVEWNGVFSSYTNVLLSSHITRCS